MPQSEMCQPGIVAIRRKPPRQFFFESDLEKLSRDLLDDQHALMADIEDSLCTASVTEHRGLIKATNAVSELKTQLHEPWLEESCKR